MRSDSLNLHLITLIGAKGTRIFIEFLYFQYCRIIYLSQLQIRFWGGSGLWYDATEQKSFKAMDYYLIFKERLESPCKIQLFCGLKSVKLVLLEKGYYEPGVQKFLGIKDFK